MGADESDRATPKAMRELLTEAAARWPGPDAAEDFRRLGEAVAGLDALMAQPAGTGDRDLRHSLRNLVNQIVGYAELLGEEAAAAGHAGAVPPLAGLRRLAAGLLGTEQGSGREAAEIGAGGVGEILVVDDGAENRDLLARYLGDLGHLVRVAADGQAGIDAMASTPPDLVLLDIHMPTLDGYEVLRRAKADPRLAHIPVIVISGSEGLDSIVRCIALGAEDYLPKPFDRTLLQARIEASLEKKRLRDRETAYLAAIQRELDLARAIQAAMLPKAPPDRPEIDIAGRMVPAREMGGDFYDLFALDSHRIALVVADASGKGVPAAFVMAAARNLLRATAPFAASPAECLARVNDLLCDVNAEEHFVTLFYGVLDCATGRLTFANAGHNPPLLLRADGPMAELSLTGGLVLGAVPGFAFAEAVVDMSAGDGLLLFSDGLVEAEGPSGQFGEERLRDTIAELCNRSATDVTDGLLYAVDCFAGGALQSDDRTCVYLRYRARG